MQKYYLLSILFMYLLNTNNAISAFIPHYSQIIVVTTPNWDAIQGNLQRYEYSPIKQRWIKIGKAFPIVVGSRGMGWGIEMQKNNWPGPIKKEGDKRTPIGLYALGPLFGFKKNPLASYLQLTPNTLCVDDSQSRYYNQIIDSSSISHRDWHSAEKMRTIPQYQWGSFIQYNIRNPVKNAGSCIFLHVWRNSNKGTAGCVAMNSAELKQLLSWIKIDKHPAIILITKPAYTYFTSQINLLSKIRME